MIELIYPLEMSVPRLPAHTAASKSRKSPAREEIFPVIDNDGFVIAKASRAYCHSGSHLLHPVVHLHLINRKEEIYLQKRSANKEIQPGKWDSSVGGHVVFGELIIEALHREAFEELGLETFNPSYLGSYVWETDRDSEFVNMFALVGDVTPKPDPEEIEEGRWWTIREIENNLDKDVFTPSFATEFLKIKQQLLSLL